MQKSPKTKIQFALNFLAISMVLLWGVAFDEWLQSYDIVSNAISGLNIEYSKRIHFAPFVLFSILLFWSLSIVMKKVLFEANETSSS